jgi:hypothetical protein
MMLLAPEPSVHRRGCYPSGMDLPKDPVIEAYKKDVDRTLIRANLRRSPEERVRALVAMHALLDEVRRARRATFP